jgi:opacity protein-like surface antigen
LAENFGGQSKTSRVLGLLHKESTMKKIFTAILFSLVPLTASFGVDFSLSAGGGGFLGGLFTRYTLTTPGTIKLENLEVPVDVASIQKINQISYGGYLFFDATWVEFSIAVHGGTNTWGEDYSAVSTDDGVKRSDSKKKGTGSEVMLDFTLLGKYPFRVNEQITLFPLVGIEYQIALAEYRKEGNLRQYSRTNVLWERDSNGNAYQLSAWNSLLIDIGAGLDFTFYPRLFLRTEFLYGFRLQTPYEVDALEMLKSQVNAPSPKLTGLTSGPTLRLSLGYRF